MLTDEEWTCKALAVWMFVSIYLQSREAFTLVIIAISFCELYIMVDEYAQVMAQNYFTYLKVMKNDKV